MTFMNNLRGHSMAFSVDFVMQWVDKENLVVGKNTRSYYGFASNDIMLFSMVLVFLIGITMLRQFVFSSLTEN
jgi:hypothetical protein